MQDFLAGLIGGSGVESDFTAAVRTMEIADRIIALSGAHRPAPTPEAVGSRDAERSQDFVDRHGDKRTIAHASYDDLQGNLSVEVVYVAVPHPFHAPLAHRAIHPGKHILVEKPFALTET